MQNEPVSRAGTFTKIDVSRRLEKPDHGKSHVTSVVCFCTETWLASPVQTISMLFRVRLFGTHRNPTG